MPQLCTICTHPNHQDINLALVRGELSNRRIATQFSVKEPAIRHHRSNHLPDLLLQSQALQKQEEADRVMQEVLRCLTDANLILSACKEYLTDPDDPGKLYIGPRASDIDVVYEDLNDMDDRGRPRHKKATLQEVINRVEMGRYEVVSTYSKHADPRELYLKSIAQLRPVAELLARLEGRLSGDGQGSNNTLTMNQLIMLANSNITIVSR